MALAVRVTEVTTTIFYFSFSLTVFTTLLNAWLTLPSGKLPCARLGRPPPLPPMPVRSPLALAMTEKFFDGEADVFGNLSQQDWRNITARMKWDGGSAPIGMAKLTMRTALPHLHKTKSLQNGGDFLRF